MAVPINCDTLLAITRQTQTPPRHAFIFPPSYFIFTVLQQLTNPRHHLISASRNLLTPLVVLFSPDTPPSELGRLHYSPRIPSFLLTPDRNRHQSSSTPLRLNLATPDCLNGDRQRGRRSISKRTRIHTQRANKCKLVLTLALRFFSVDAPFVLPDLDTRGQLAGIFWIFDCFRNSPRSSGMPLSLFELGRSLWGSAFLFS